MASWMVGRLVSGLGASSNAAALPLVRKASCDAAASSPLLCLTSSAWKRWQGPNHESHTKSSAISAGSTALPTPSSAFAAGCHEPAAASTQPSTRTSRAEAVFINATAYITTNRTSTRTWSGFAAATGGYAAFATAAAATREAAGPVRGFARTSASSASVGDPAEKTGTPAVGAAEGLDTAALGEAKPDLVEKFLSLDVCSSGMRRQAERQQVLKDFQSHPADTGSPPVMVALWTHRVRSLVRVFDSGRKQLPSIRSLEMLVNMRRRMLTWLRHTDFESYSYTISKLGLRDIYVPTGGPYRYREGLRANDQADDQINRLRFNFHTKYRQGKTSMWYRLRPKLVAEDPVLQAADAAAAVEDRQRRQQRREVAAQQRMAAEREQKKK